MDAAPGDAYMPVWKRAVTASHKIPTGQADADAGSDLGGEGDELEEVPEIVIQAPEEEEEETNKKKKRVGKAGLPDLVLYFDALKYHQAVIAELKTYWAYLFKHIQAIFSIEVLTNNNRGIKALGYLEDNNLTVIQGPNGGYFDWRQKNVGAQILKQVCLSAYEKDM